jgi:uncharacterized protein (DUF302 family)
MRVAGGRTARTNGRFRTATAEPALRMNAGVRRTNVNWENPMSESLGFEVELPLAFAAAMDATRDALKAEGFGILTEIDLQAAFKEKLGRDFRPYVILGACNPPLAFAAVTADPAIGLLLPCNVTVEARDATHSVVRLVDPQLMLSSAPGGLAPELISVADDASQRMARVREVLRRVGRPST